MEKIKAIELLGGFNPRPSSLTGEPSLERRTTGGITIVSIRARHR